MTTNEQGRRINQIADAMNKAIPEGVPAEDAILAMAILLSSSFNHIIDVAADKQAAVQWVAIQKLQFDLTVANSMARAMPMAQFTNVSEHSARPN